MYDYQKLSNHPLILALAEFRFSAVLDIEKYIPRIQEELRSEFPFPHQMSNQEIQVNPTGIEVRNNLEWAFVSQNKRSAIMLSTNRLVFLTSNYDRFEGFKSSCELGLTTLETIVKPALLLRIGLRYSDTIVRKDDNCIEQFVHNSVSNSAHLHNLGSPIRQTKENFIKTNEGHMVIRSMWGINNFPLWPDLNNLPILVKEDQELTDRILLDFDHFWQPEDESNAPKFSAQNILDSLDKMHLRSRQAFWDITTEEGRISWK